MRLCTVACVSLSMGGPYFLAFLNQQTQEWKDKYIHTYTSMDGAFGGSASATTFLVSTAGTQARCRTCLPPLMPSTGGRLLGSILHQL